MPLIRSRYLVQLALLALGFLIVASCGSTAIATPTPTSPSAGVAATPASTPGAGLTGPAAKGRELFVQFQCSICHSVTGERIVGPPLNGVYESSVSLSNGETVVADEGYLKLALLQPDSQIVNGYPSGVMSGHIQQFQSQIAQPDNLNALVAYIESLK